MVAADHDQRHLKVGQFSQDPVEQVDRVQRRDSTIENVARNGHCLDALLAHRVQQMFEEGALLREEGHAMQLTAEMPVRSVQDPHKRTP